MVTKCSSNKGFSGYSDILPHFNFCGGGQVRTRNPLLLLHSTVTTHLFELYKAKNLIHRFLVSIFVHYYVHKNPSNVNNNYF